MLETVPVVEGMFDQEGLIGGSCGCGRRHFPAAATCPWCGAEATGPVRLATEGRLWAWTSVRTAPPGYEGPVPFGFGVVELEADALRVVTLLTEPDPARLHLGQAMAFTTMAVRDGDGDAAVAWAFGPVAP